MQDQIVSMTLDKELGVAVLAIRLIIIIHKHHPEKLSNKDIEAVYLFVYSSHRVVARAAGEFLSECFAIDERNSALRTLRGKKRLPNTPLIRDLIQFFIESRVSSPFLSRTITYSN